MRQHIFSSGVIITSFCFIQPTPAPFVIPVAVAAGAAVDTAAAGAARARMMIREDDTGEYPVDFQSCMSAILTSNPTLAISVNNTVITDDVPAVCMSYLDVYNKNPDIAGLEAMTGVARPVNNTAVIFTQVPTYIMDYVQGQLAANHGGRGKAGGKAGPQDWATGGRHFS
jgi:hypothetical protein